MKTKLLLLLAIMNSAFGFSQFIIFSNLTATSTSATTANLSVTVPNACTYGATIALQVANSAAFNPLTLSQGFPNINTPGSVNYTITGLTVGQTIYWRFYGQLNAGCTNNTIISATQSYTHQLPGMPTPIAEYNFDNAYTNANGDTPFTNNAGTSFTTDRHGNATGALNIQNTGSAAYIPNLPYGTSNRTISVWAKSNILNTQINYIFHYGTEANGNGLAFRPDKILYFANASANLETLFSTPNNTWVHYVCTYDGTNAKVYRNGTLFSSGAYFFNTANNADIFKLGLSESAGNNYFNGAIDDLKIYGFILTDAEILNLFTNNTLSTADFHPNNLEVSLYPNPATDILNIQTDIEIKSIEIYNIQGQKVISSNQKQINVAALASGMYMIKIQDAANNSAIKKVIIK